MAYKIIDSNLLRKEFCDMLTELHDRQTEEAYHEEIGARTYMERLIELIEGEK